MRAMPRVIHKQVRAGDIPESWDVHVADHPDTVVTVIILPERRADTRPLLSFLGAGRGVYGSAEEADRHLDASRDAWET
jgi:hypothetical protein